MDVENVRGADERRGDGMEGRRDDEMVREGEGGETHTEEI